MYEQVQGFAEFRTPRPLLLAPTLLTFVCVCVCVCVRYVRRRAFICVGGEGKRGLGVAGLEAAPIICAERCVEGARGSTRTEPLQNLVA